MPRLTGRESTTAPGLTRHPPGGVGRTIINHNDACARQVLRDSSHDLADRGLLVVSGNDDEIPADLALIMN